MSTSSSTALAPGTYPTTPTIPPRPTSSTSTTAAPTTGPSTTVDLPTTSTTEAGGTTTITAPPLSPEIPTVPVVRGSSVDVDGAGCAPGAEVRATIADGRTLGTAVADADGSFTIRVGAPADLSLGEHLVTATCTGPDGSAARVRSVSFGGAQVNANGTVEQYIRLLVRALVPSTPGSSGYSPTTSSGGSLARTGSNGTATAVVGFTVLLLGATFVAASRRIRAAR